jgi:hypothetical protein
MMNSIKSRIFYLMTFILLVSFILWEKSFWMFCSAIALFFSSMMAGYYYGWDEGKKKEGKNASRL